MLGRALLQRPPLRIKIMDEMGDYISLFDDEHRQALAATSLEMLCDDSNPALRQKTCNFVARMRRDGHLTSQLDDAIQHVEDSLPGLKEMRRNAERILDAQSDIKRQAGPGADLPSPLRKRKLAGREELGPRKAPRVSPTPDTQVSDTSAEHGSVRTENRESTSSVAAGNLGQGRTRESHGASFNFDERSRSRGSGRESYRYSCHRLLAS